MVDPLSFRSDRLPTEHFNARFSADNLSFWVPLLIEAAQIDARCKVLDVGCGTGGFARAIAEAASARVTGYDVSERFIEHARGLPPPRFGAVEWVVGEAEDLPFEAESFDRVLLSLVLHQLARPLNALVEALGVLRAEGLVLVRTIAPEDVADRVPERYLKGMAEVDAARMPRIEALERLLEQAGFGLVATHRHLRNKMLDLQVEERALLTEAQARYRFLTTNELEQAISRMREDYAASHGEWIDPRPTYLIVGSKQPR